MREVLFRGKRTDNGEWVYGYFFIDCENGDSWIQFPVVARDGSAEFECVRVAPESVGQVVGLLDKNSKKIFEGDIVKGLFLFGMEIRAKVTFYGGAFGLTWYRGCVEEFSAFSSICNMVYEVVGNVHDNPELLAEWQDIRRE